MKEAEARERGQRCVRTYISGETLASYNRFVCGLSWALPVL
jgi:hypothetical protein